MDISSLNNLYLRQNTDTARLKQKANKLQNSFQDILKEKNSLSIKKKENSFPINSKTPLNKKQKDAAKLQKLSSEFEAVLLQQMLKAMRKTVHKGDLINGGYAEEIFTGMLDEQRALNMAKSDKFGLGKLLFKELSKHL